MARKPLMINVVQIETAELGLGRRDEVEASGLIDGLIASAARHSRRSIVLSSFYRGELRNCIASALDPI